MAVVRDINEAKPAPKKRLKKYHIVVILVAALFFFFVIGKSISNYAQALEYNRQANAIEEEASSVSQNSADISETLKPENHQDYFEKIAREEYGYGKPGEKVYYNSSFGE